MAEPLPWPTVLVPSSEDWTLRGGSRSGGQTFQGHEQIVASPTARWKATLTIPCFKRTQILAMRRLIALGRTQNWNVGPYELTRSPWNIDLVGGKITYAQAAKRPDLYFGDQDPRLLFHVGDDTPLNATTIVVERVRGGVLEPGMMFSIYGRLHTIVDLPAGELGTAPGTQGTAGRILLAIRPWLRLDTPAGWPLEFGAPVATMRLASDDTGAMELQLSRYGSVTLDLVEAF